MTEQVNEHNAEEKGNGYALKRKKPLRRREIVHAWLGKWACELANGVRTSVSEVWAREWVPATYGNAYGYWFGEARYPQWRFIWAG